MKRVSNLQSSSYRRLPITERPGLLPNFFSSLCRRHWRPVNGDLQCFAGWRERTATDDNATIWWNSWSLVLPVHKGPNEPESMRATDCYGQLQNFQYQTLVSCTLRNKEHQARLVLSSTSLRWKKEVTVLIQASLRQCCGGGSDSRFIAIDHWSLEYCSSPFVLSHDRLMSNVSS